MSTNREQHELAAKAAGLLLLWKTGSCKGGEVEAPFIGDQPWRPKEDDGDALRLAVACGIEVGNAQQYLRGLAVYGGKEFWEINPDLFTAARLAIFSAAVDIGKAMP